MKSVEVSGAMIVAFAVVLVSAASRDIRTAVFGTVDANFTV